LYVTFSPTMPTAAHPVRTKRGGQAKRPAAVPFLRGEAAKVAADEVVVVVVVGHEAPVVSRMRVKGRVPGRRGLGLRLAGAQAAVESLVAAGPRAAGPALSQGEAAMLDDAGLVAAEDDDAVTALDRARIELELMLRESLTLDDAAAALGVGASRLRQ